MLCGIALVAARRTGVAAAASIEDWLPISPADLALADNPAEPGDDAMILYRSVRVDVSKATYGGEIVDEYVRIKIFTATGAQTESSRAIAFVKGDSKIKNLQARTIKPDGTVVNFDGQIFERPVAKSGRFGAMEQTFSLQQVDPGSIIEFKYTRAYGFGFHELAWTVSDELYTREAHFSIRPGSGTLSLNFRSTNLPKDALPQKQPDHSYAMQVHDVRGVREEPLSPPGHLLESRVEFFYSFPGSTVSSSDEFWKRVGEYWRGGGEYFIDKKHSLEKVVNETVSPADTPDQKLRKLYDRAQSVHNLDFENEKSEAERKVEKIKSNDNVEDLIKHNYGGSEQINLFFVGLARAAGFKAELAFIAMRDRNTFVSTSEDTSQLDTSLVWVQTDKTEYWLDPAAKFYPFGLLPWNETECKGLRLTAKAPEPIVTQQQSSGDSVTIRRVELEIAEDGSSSGTFEATFNGSTAAQRRTSLFNEDDLGRKKALEDDFKARLPAGAEVSVTEASDWNDNKKALVAKGTLKLSGFATTAGSHMLVPASVFASAYADSFNSTTRVNPIRFPQRFEEIDDFVMRTPAGYSVEAVPTLKPVKSGDLFNWSVDVSQHDGAIEIRRSFSLNAINFPSDQYATLRGMFMNIKANDASQIPLTSKPNAKPAAASAPSKN
jgi:hypothetical protein